MTDEQIAEFGYAHSDEHDEPLFAFDRAGFIACVRAILARQPAAIGKEAVAWIFDDGTPREQWTRIGNLHFDGPNEVQLELAEKYGWKWIPLYAAPLDKEESKPALPQGFTVKRVEGHGWVIDPPSGSRWVAFEGTPAGELMQALAASPAAPSVEQDERGAFGWPWLAELHADAAYLFHRVQQGSLSPDDAAKIVRDKIDRAPTNVAQGAKLAVCYGPMPESNGKTNWTAILHKGDLAEGHTIDRSEYPDRVRYAADCVRYLIGELKERPWILDYDADKHSGYVANVAQGAERKP